ncbi:MAG: glycosyltransferase family 39 protein, partial [Myxococcaceae bacterium]|nr:glycosyltransferase family 39 protein [Myxococcaceae bacterium]
MRRLAVLAPLLPLLLGLDAELQDVDAAQYADVARRMVASGDWLTLSHSQGPFVNKPPFSMWAQAVCITALGPTSVAARLPALLFAVLTVLAVRGIGRQLFDDRVGELAAFLTASTAALHVMVIDPKVDLALTATTSCAVWAFLAARQASRWAFAGWALTGLALLTKGPLGVAIVAAAIAPEAVREPGRLRFQPLLGPLLVAALAAPFYWTVWKVYGPENVEYLLWRQSMGRFNGSSGYVDATSPLFYVHTSAWAFLPWTPALLVVLVRKARRLGNVRLPDWQRVPAWWFALPFAAFSVSDYKLPQYVYALTPAVALLCAPWLCEASAAALRRLRWRLAALAAGGAVGGAAALA